jgi:hypothetical protein
MNEGMGKNQTTESSLRSSQRSRQPEKQGEIGDLTRHKRRERSQEPKKRQAQKERER